MERQPSQAVEALEIVVSEAGKAVPTVSKLTNRNDMTIVADVQDKLITALGIIAQLAP